MINSRVHEKKVVFHNNPFCTHCGADLTEQPGFNMHLSSWLCTECGQAGFSDWLDEWICLECGKVNRIRVGEYMIADMYHLGRYVEKNDGRCREILENMLDSVVDEIDDDRFALSTLFPEIAIRYVDLNVYEGKVSEVDSDCLYLAKDILSNRQAKRPFISV